LSGVSAGLYDFDAGQRLLRPQTWVIATMRRRRLIAEAAKGGSSHSGPPPSNGGTPMAMAATA